VYDTCNDSDFPAAPIVALDNDSDYWIGKGDLVIDVDWEEDTVSASTNFDCGPYQILTELDSAASEFNDEPYNSTQNSIEQIANSKKLKVRFDQPKLSGALKFNVKIGSDLIDDDSPVRVWTLNVHSCEVKENDWVTPLAPIKHVVYDIRKPLDPTKDFETFEYKGPPYSSDFCYPPNFSIADSDGIDIDFICPIFDEGMLILMINNVLTD
jgi:hypothetical protein